MKLDVRKKKKKKKENDEKKKCKNETSALKAMQKTYTKANFFLFIYLFNVTFFFTSSDINTLINK